MLANLGFANISIFREFLRENELLSKTILAYLSGAQMALIHEVKKCQKSRDTAPLNPRYLGPISFDMQRLFGTRNQGPCLVGRGQKACWYSF